MITDTVNIDIQKTEHSRIHELLEGELVFGRLFSDHMFVADFDNGEWTNCSILPYQKLTMAPSTLVFHYGQAIFEGMKAFKNTHGDAYLFRPEANIERFNKSAERMCMPAIPKEIFLEGLSQLINLDRDWIPVKEDSSLYIRPFMIATDEYIGVKASDSYKFMIITSPVGAYYSEPVKVKIETHFTRATEGGTGFVKSAGNYGAALYPAKKAQQQGYHQLVWTDAKEHRYIEESGTMNVMFVINDTLITPPLSSTTLQGVTRDSVLTIARDWGWKVEERKIAVDEVVEATKNNTLKEAFGTGTAATIAHINLISYQGIDYELPPIEVREFSVKAERYLKEIRTGIAKDKFNWMVKM